MPDKIAAGLVSRTYFNVPLWAAQEHGFFAKEGLQVEGTIYGNASQVAPLLDGTFQVYIGSPESPFKRIEDLRGRMIGIFSDKEGTFFHVKAMLEAHGLSYPGDYQVKHTGGVPPRHKALLAGEIDAGLQSVPWNYVAEEVGMNNLGDVIEYVPDWQFVSVNINSQWAEKNRDVLVRFLRAILRATEWLYANRAAASAIAARELPAPIHHAERAWDFFTGTDALTRDVSVNLKGLAQVIATLKETNLLAKSASDDPKAYVDESYLKAARAAA
jgi:ABC-type nitrate/sulfonate/bicarbonate transport system substrate-binding protein